MIVEQPGFWLAVLQIIWIDILLSGDNAVVIALACRKLPPKQRVWGVVLGTVVAISLRVVFAGLVTTLMQMAYLKLVGGVLLLWIAVKLLGPEENGKSGEVEPVDTLWRAIRIVAIADLVMSLDNVIAIAAVAERFEVAAKLRAADVRSRRQHSADHGRRRDGHVAARALPHRGVGRRRPARLDRRRDHRQGPAVHRQPRSRRGAHGMDDRRDAWARCSWSAPVWCDDAGCGAARPTRSSETLPCSAITACGLALPDRP